MLLDMGLAVVVVGGGWYVGPCNIPIIDWKSFSNEQFLKEFAYQQPFVLRDGRDNTVSIYTLFKISKFCPKIRHEERT